MPPLPASHPLQTAVEVHSEHKSAADSPLYESAEYGISPTLPYPAFLFSGQHGPKLYLCEFGHAKLVTNCG